MLREAKEVNTGKHFTAIYKFENDFGWNMLQLVQGGSLQSLFETTGKPKNISFPYSKRELEAINYATYKTIEYY